MNRKSYSQVLDSMARDRMAEGTDLTPRILARIQKGKHRTMQPRTKVFTTAVLILLVLLIVSISVPAVRAAIQRWIGYVPGVGLVSEGQIRVLEKPLSVTRDGITLRLERVLADSRQTTIVYSVKGLTADMLVQDPGDPSRCSQNTALRFAEGEFHYGAETSGFGENGEGYQSDVRYPALPTTANEATLVIPCLPSTLAGKAPENWEISFRLIPAPPELTAFPVIEIPTSSAAPGNAILPTDPNTDPLAAGIFLTLDRAVQMDDGYLLYATLHWESSKVLASINIDSSTIRLLDANGQEVPQLLDYDAVLSLPYEHGKTFLAIKTESLQLTGPLTLVIDSVQMQLTVDTNFVFDPGPHPQPGQVWEINQEVDLGYGRALRVLRATYPRDSPDPGFSFDMESDAGIVAASLRDWDHPLVQDTGVYFYYFEKEFHDDFYYTEGIPAGPITVTIVEIAAPLQGHWEAQWTPPIPEGQIVPTSQDFAQYSACLTRASWTQALQQHESLPPGLTGTLALQSMVPPTYHAEVSVVRLDGSDRKSVGPGLAPSLSPDGTRVVHVGPMVAGPADGLYITELATGTTTRLPGTTTGDWGPLWSPDGQKIAFTREPASGELGAPHPSNIMVTQVDGSDFHQLTKGEGAKLARAWMPDGNHLIYTNDLSDDATLHTINVQTREVHPLSGINGLSAAISPDGKRLAFHEMISGDQAGLFVSNLDGSNRKLLADHNPYAVTSPTWSPDGNWIIVSVIDLNVSQLSNPALALIRVDECQIIPLPKLSGYVSSWLP